MHRVGPGPGRASFPRRMREGARRLDNAQTRSPEAAASGPRRARPLSPHLGIYKLIPTMLASIMHRITGAALYFGTLLVAWWLLAAATGPEAYAVAAAVLTNPLGLIVMFGYTLLLVIHALGGIRHFIWDMGAMMDKYTTTKMAYATGIGGLAITVAIWIIGFIAL